MSSPTEVADTPTLGNTHALYAGQSAISLDNKLSAVVLPKTSSVYPLSGLSKLLDNEDTYDPKPQLNQYWKDHMTEYLDNVETKVPANPATPAGNPSQSQGSFTSNYVRQHAKIFGKGKNPYLAQVAKVPEPEPEPESKSDNNTVNLEDFIDPSLLAQDTAQDTAREASSVQEASSSIRLPMTESFVNGIIQDINAIEPLLEDETWVSLLDPASKVVPAPDMGLGPQAFMGTAPYTQPATHAVPVPYAQPYPYAGPVAPAGPAFYTQPLPYTEPLSYMGQAPYTGPAYTQAMPPMNQAFNTQPASYPQLNPYHQQGMPSGPVAYPQFGPSPPAAPYAQPASYPQPFFNPQPTPGVNMQPGFQPQPVQARNVQPDFLAMPPPPPPREFTSHYFNNMSAVDYGISTRQYLNQQVGFSAPGDLPATNPHCALPESNAFPYYQVESPKGKGKAPCRRGGNTNDFMGII
ncbi:uncharacterized protein F4812DRAFT_469848 [Daldinia caldariorum]|uniref:uncharacterized protein n=1 Tax=Daldinia caldariorum TaxID=326644 RepID=UPI002007DBE6|nr:uncharacterized protein F4812DRAFT_469848 [Daldinia caldariorum]KAI1469771.1 hypothetical protein F4812DRAFT_469848 [Daldinia caldariorum]